MNKKFMIFIILFNLLSIDIFAKSFLGYKLILLDTGDYIRVTLGEHSGCYTLFVASEKGSKRAIFGKATNCSDNIKSYWNIKGCGDKQEEEFYGDPAKALIYIIDSCKATHQE